MKADRRPLPPEFVLPVAPCNVTVQRCPVERAVASHRILIMRLGAYGDILMGTPLLAALRQAYPNAHLTWLVERNAREAIDANPYIDEILLWKSSYWRKVLRKGSRLFRWLWALRARPFRQLLKKYPFDLFISFQPEEWPLLVQEIKAPQNVGVFDTYRQFYRSTRTSSHTQLYATAYTIDDLPQHRTDQYLLPLKALGLPPATDKRMQIGYTTQDEAEASDFLEKHHVRSTDRLVVIAPFTTWPSRCWPTENYKELIDQMTERGFRVVVLGSGKEYDAVSALAAHTKEKPILAAGALNFRAVAALIARSNFVISGDTGPMHVAAALGTPFIALFGPTPTSVLAPLAGGGVLLSHEVPCGPCGQKVCTNTGATFMRCMKLITVSEVLKATEKTMAEIPALLSSR